jgi:hypothetical protein
MVAGCFGLGGLPREPRVLDQAPDVLRAKQFPELREFSCSERPKPDVHAYFGIWYFDAQSSIVDQSRLSKNASM